MMTMTKSMPTAIALALAVSTTTAFASDVDVSPRVFGSRIVADGHDDGAGTTEPNMRVFGWEFGESPADPFAIGDPGFNAFDGSGLPAGSQFGLRVLEDLGYWDGTGPVSFGPVPAGETIKFEFGTQMRTVGTGTGELTDFFFGPLVDADGGFHEHLDSFLQGSDGNAVPASTDGIEATTGAYLVQLSLISSDSSIMDSHRIYAIFNNGLDESVFESSEDHFNAIVPLPTAVWAALPLLAVVAIKRTKSSG